MADEKTDTKLPWGRYEHESGAWIQFKKGPYRYREQREWRNCAVPMQLYAYIVKRLEAWRLVDADGNELDLEALRPLAVAATNTPAVDADTATMQAALTAIERFESAFDEVDITLLRWLVSSGNTFAYVDMPSAPKA